MRNRVFERYLLASVVCLLMTSAARGAEDSFFDLPLGRLTITEGKLPKLDARQFQYDRSGIRNYIVLDGAGDAYGEIPFRDQGGSDLHIYIHTPDQRDVTGRLFIENDTQSGMTEVKFKVTVTAAKPEAKNAFYLAMENHYGALLAEGDAGAGWFRHRADEAHNARDDRQNDNRSIRWQSQSSLDDTYSLLSGNQAVAENLQLDKALPAASTQPDEREVEVNSLQGIAVAAINWKEKIAGKHPGTDPLAAAIPADQHAIFFHDFNSLIALADEADRTGTPVLQFAETQAQDAGTRLKYERQLGLSLSGMGRIIGPQLVSSVAITGSDPYLRGGSDLAILFEPKMGDALLPLLAAQIDTGAKTIPGAARGSGNIGGISYTSVRSPDRAISSYLATLKNGTVVISNSPEQLSRLALVEDGKADALSGAPEYIFFRDRYKIDDSQETALLVLTDATIRRWCGARWRIADSRRTRAAAVLADLNAKNLDVLVAGKVDAAPVHGEFTVPDLGELHMSDRGASSDGYGSLDFLTPIVEMKFDKVKQVEADAYDRWRQTYETNWRGFFDPIAVRFTVSQGKLAADLSVMPLIAGSDYRTLISIAGNARLDAAKSDPHDCLYRTGIAIDTNAEELKSARMSISSLAPGVRLDPFSWVGQSVWLYADHDSFWKDWAAAGEQDNFVEKNIARLPVALRIEVANGITLAAWLVAAHAFVDQSAPGMTVWDNVTYKDHPFGRITPGLQAMGESPIVKDLAIYYHATGDALVITLSQKVMENSIDRQIAREADKKAGRPATQPDEQPLLGQSVAAQVREEAMELIVHAGGKRYQTFMQERSWSNLPILTELKHRYPDQDPLKIYLQFFHAKLLDPSAGQYVWNDKWQTMESTIYGCPAEPRSGPTDVAALKGILRANFGVTFEDSGLRARTEVDRESK